jgi:PEP-CTERM/exosortase A-associated glycosyltransferase
MAAQAAYGLDVKGVTGLRHRAQGPAVERAEGLTFHRTRGAPGPLREWGEIAALTDAISAVVDVWRPDVLHAHSPALCGLAALRAARRHALPLVYEIRAFWEDAAVGNGTGREGSVKYRLTRRLENRVVARADAVVTICHGLRDDLIARGFAGGRIGIMPNGVDLAMFGDPPPRDEALRDELKLGGKDGGGPVIGFIGSFYDYEGLDVLIEAMPLLLAERPGARLLLVGGGPVEDALRRQAQGSPAAGAIRFVGRVPHGEVERYYSLCDVMVYPRKASRLTELVTPLKPLEAMAQGKLVAASAVGGHREPIADGITGTLFAPDDPADCAASLSQLLARRGEWEAMRAAARAHVSQRHDWARNARRYRDIYQALLGRPDDTRLCAAA